MIKFKHANKDYSVSFFRGEKSVCSLKRTIKRIVGGKEHFFLAKNHPDCWMDDNANLKCTRTVTGARIKVRDGDTYKPITSGLSVCSPQDKFDVGKGRKKAIANALNLCNDSLTNIISKTFRIALWEAYFQQCKDGQLINGQRISAISSNVTAVARRKSRRQARHK